MRISKLPASQQLVGTVNPAFAQPRTPALPLQIVCHLLGFGHQLHSTGLHQPALQLHTHPSPCTHQTERPSCLPYTTERAQTPLLMFLLLHGHEFYKTGGPPKPRGLVWVCDGTVLRLVGEVPQGAADSQTPEHGKASCGWQPRCSVPAYASQRLAAPQSHPPRKTWISEALRKHPVPEVAVQCWPLAALAVSWRPLRLGLTHQYPGPVVPKPPTTRTKPIATCCLSWFKLSCSFSLSCSMPSEHMRSSTLKMLRSMLRAEPQLSCGDHESYRQEERFPRR